VHNFGKNPAAKLENGTNKRRITVIAWAHFISRCLDTFILHSLAVFVYISMAYSSYWDPQSYSLIAPSDEIDQNHDGRRTSSFSLQSSSSIPESPFGMVTTEISPHTESLRASVGSIDLGISPISLPPAKQTLPPGFGDVAPQKSFRKQKRDGAEFHQAGASRLGIDTIQEEGHDADEANVGANIVDLNVESYNGRADMVSYNLS